MLNNSGLVFEDQERRIKVYVSKAKEQYAQKYEEIKQKKPSGVRVVKSYRQEDRKSFMKDGINILSQKDVRLYAIPAFKVVNFLVFGDENWPEFLRKQEKYLTKDFSYQPSKDDWQEILSVK